jgi:hypothetical protein
MRTRSVAVGGASRLRIDSFRRTTISVRPVPSGLIDQAKPVRLGQPSAANASSSSGDQAGVAHRRQSLLMGETAPSGFIV